LLAVFVRVTVALWQVRSCLQYTSQQIDELSSCTA
jgi:hypothetical protein